MSDPDTLSAAVIGSAALTEGIKFLYRQAGEILKRWRERRDKPREEQPLMTTAPARRWLSTAAI